MYNSSTDAGTSVQSDVLFYIKFILDAGKTFRLLLYTSRIKAEKVCFQV